MMPHQSPSLLALLDALSDELDVPASKYKQAAEHYNAVGNWLGSSDSALAPFGLTVYAQGSFALGTAIRPSEGADYDVDAVCLLQRPPGWTQEQLKSAVGERLKQHKTYRTMLDPPSGGRRCWTLKYADGSQFHLDVLPARPDDPRWLHALGVPPRLAADAIEITCRDHYCDARWPKSNPRGYLKWFINRMQVRFDEARTKLAAARASRIEDVPEYETRTTLQRVVQILKRQRDVMFGDDCDRPISIIITTLAAKAYDNESDLEEAYRNIARGMRSKLQFGDGQWLILNPVNPEENFADRWPEFPEKQEKFFAWLDAVERTEQRFTSSSDFEKRAELLLETFGTPGARAASASVATGGGTSPFSISEGIKLASGLQSILAAPHREPTPWPREIRHKASVNATASRDGFRTVLFSDGSPSPPLRKGMDLRFRLSTSAPAPYDVHWQVLNTGAEAEFASSLRGGFTRDGAVHLESTKYTGRHYVQAFVIKDGRCVAESKPVFVIIK
jgi:hypothetical protein